MSSRSNAASCSRTMAGCWTVWWTSSPNAAVMSCGRNPMKGLGPSMPSVALSMSRCDASDSTAGRSSVPIGLFLPPVRVSPFDQHEGHGEHGRLFFGLDLDLVVSPQQQVFGAPFFHRQQTDSIAHPSAGLDRRDEAHALEAVVERALDTRGPDEDIERRGGQQGQGEKAVRDGTAIGTFAARAFDVDVKPLVVARAGRELVNASLVDRDPLGNAELAAHERSDVRETERSLCQGGHLTHGGAALRPARHASRR